MIKSASQVLAEVTADPHEVDHVVVSVISSLTKDAVCFERSTNLYNSDFFKSESPQMRSALCTALADFFAPSFSNSYWNSNRQPMV